MPVTVPFNKIQGIQQTWNAPPLSAEDLVDAEWNPMGGWRECGGYRAILDPVQGSPAFTGHGKVDAITWFSQHNGGIQWLIWEHNGNLVYFNGSTKGYTSLYTSLASGRYTTEQPWQRTQFCAVNNNLYIINGEDPPLRFDGEYLIPAGFSNAPSGVVAAGPTEGFIETTTFADLGLGERNDYDNGNGNGEYWYAITEVNDLGIESPPSVVAGPVKWIVQQESSTSTSPGYKCFTRVTVPKASGSHVVARRLYRSKNCYRLSGGSNNTVMIGNREYSDGERIGNGLQTLLHPMSYRIANADALAPNAPQIQGELHFLQEFPSRDRFLFVDAHPDSVLGSVLRASDFGPWPRGAKYIAHYRGCLWLAGMPEYPNRLVYSSPVQVENFPPQQYFALGNSDSGEITGIRAVQNVLVVFKRRGIYVIQGDPMQGFHADTLTETLGCSACNTVREVPGVGLVFVSDAGVYALIGDIGRGGAQPVHIGKDLQDWWNHRITLSALANACGEVHAEKKEYWLSLPIDGNPENNMVFVYHYEIGQWSRRPGFPIACMTTSHDHRAYLFFGSNDSSSHPGVHQYSHGWPDKDGTAIGFTYRSNPIDLDGRYKTFTVMAVTLFVLNRGDLNVTLRYFLDRKGTARSAAQARDSQDIKNRAAVWGTATWSDSEAFVRQHPTAIRFDVKAVAEEFQVEIAAPAAAITGESTSPGAIELVGLYIEVEPGAKRVREPNAAILNGSATDT